MRKLILLFTAPKAIFHSLVKRPDLKMPLLLIGVSSILTISTGFTDPRMTLSSSAKVGACIFSVFLFCFGCLLWFVKTGVLHSIGKLLGNNTKFMCLASVIGYCYFPVVIGQIILFLILLIVPYQRGFTLFSVAAFFPKMDINSPIYVFISTLNAFHLWAALLMVVSVTIVFNISYRKALCVLTLYWILAILSRIIISKIIGPTGFASVL